MRNEAIDFIESETEREKRRKKKILCVTHWVQEDSNSDYAAPIKENRSEARKTEARKKSDDSFCMQKYSERFSHISPSSHERKETQWRISLIFIDCFSIVLAQL